MDIKNMKPSEFYVKYWRVYDNGEWVSPRELTEAEKEFMDKNIDSYDVPYNSTKQITPIHNMVNSLNSNLKKYLPEYIKKLF